MGEHPVRHDGPEHQADVNVIALVGERGGKCENSSSETWPRRTAPFCGGGSHPVNLPNCIKGAMVASTIAEYFRDQGADVLFMMDSVTRLPSPSGK